MEGPKYLPSGGMIRHEVNWGVAGLLLKLVMTPNWERNVLTVHVFNCDLNGERQYGSTLQNDKVGNTKMRIIAIAH